MFVDKLRMSSVRVLTERTQGRQARSNRTYERPASESHFVSFISVLRRMLHGLVHISQCQAKLQRRTARTMDEIAT